MANIKPIKLTSLLTESPKKQLTEAKAYGIVLRVDDWDHYRIGNPNDFNLSKDWKSIGMPKRPDNLSEDELKAALVDCDRNIKRAKTLLDMANKAKEQFQALSDSAATISAGEKEYENIQLTPQNILDFLKSIFIDDKDNVKAIYEMYNAFVKKEMPRYKDLILTSPSDLVGRGRVRGKDDVIFEFKRQSGGEISEWALENSLFEFIKKDYPEVADLLLIQRRTWSASFKKYFTVRVKRSAMASGPAINRAWRRIFIKYADWVDA